MAALPNSLTHYYLTDAVEDDLALEVVVLLGTVAGDQAAAQLIVNTGILHSLVNLLNGMCVQGSVNSHY